jgi:hypothetical protein
MNRQQRSRASSDDESIDSSSLSTSLRTVDTQTAHEIQSPFSSKSIPSFADTQLLSVYYPFQSPTDTPTKDKCIFVDQQDRQPVRYRATYDPSSSTKSTSSIDKNQHSITNKRTEAYTVRLDDKQTRTSSSSSSSVTTVIAQNGAFDSDHTSRSSFDGINIRSSTNGEKPPIINNQRVSSWPPVPDDILPTNNQNEKRPSHVQFAEQLVHVIPISTTTSISDGSIPISETLSHAYINEQLQRVDHHPKNQSKWIKTHLDNSELQTKTTSNRVDTLRSMFEHNTPTLNNATNHIQSEEKPSKYGTEIRFSIKDSNTSTVHHAEPAKVVSHASTSTQEEQSISPFNLNQIRQITGKQFISLNDIGRYLQVNLVKKFCLLL